MSETLHTKYRPKTFDDVRGHKAIIKSLGQVLKDGHAHTFLFHGPAGCGKTTFARIIANIVGCSASNLIEIDAATHTGIDAMRGVTESVVYRPFGEGESRVVIVDECHRLSAAAWTSLLKATEEPPKHAYWVFCTTDLNRVPAAIKTRCASYHVKPLDNDTLYDLVLDIVEQEKLKTSEDVIDLVVSKSEGSPRQALVYLAACADCKDRKEALPLLEAVQSGKGVIDLARLLVKGGRIPWARVTEIIKGMEDENAESVRIVIYNYVGKVLISSTSDQAVVHCLKILDAFSEPINSSSGMAAIVHATGRVLYTE